MLEKKHSAIILISLLFFSVPNSFAAGIEDIIQQQKQKEWHVGSNLNPGDSFTYKICDERTFTKSNFAEKCYTIQLDFYDIFEVPNGKTWIVQSSITTDSITKPGIFQMDADTFEITTDASNLEFAHSVKNTLFDIGKFANSNNPKILQVGQSWGTIPSYLTADSDIIVLDEDVTEIDSEEFESFSIGYNVKKQSTYSISKQFPFPLWGQVYSSTVIYPEPDFLFSFELLRYDFALMENSDSGTLPNTANSDSVNNLIPIEDDFSENSNDLICIPSDSLKFSAGSFVIDETFVTEIKQQKHLKQIESEIIHETFVRSIDDISEN